MAYPIRDPNEQECTRDPIFLFQRRRVVLCQIPDGFAHDGDGWWVENFDEIASPFDDCVTRSEDYGWEVNDNKLRKLMLEYSGDAVIYAYEQFETELVFLTREAAEAYGSAKHYRFADGWRVYCVHAHGELAELLNKNEQVQEAANG